MSPPRLFRLTSVGRLACGLAGLALAAAPALRAADEPPAKEISEDLAAGLEDLRPLLDAKKYPECLALIAKLAKTAAPESYDFVILTQLESQLLMTQGELQRAVGPLERSLAVAERHAFLPPATLYEQYYLLAQIHNQRAAEAKDVPGQQAGFTRALEFLRKAKPLAPKLTADFQLLTASLLYNLGAQGGRMEPDTLREAIAEARRGLHLAVRPPEQLYQLILASHQQLGELEPAAETLELIVRLKPDGAQSWQQLMAVYLNLAGGAADDAARDKWNLRAILTLERAQARGLLQGPAENYTLVALHFAIRDYARAAALLEAGLPSGRVEGSRRNWELLANSYQQLEDAARALDALGRAAAAFPEEGQFEFLAAQIHYAAGRVTDAYARAAAATAKGKLDKPGQAYLYLAYLGYELGRYEDAARWLDQAGAHADVKPAEIAPVRRAVTDALKERTATSKS